MDKPAFSLDEYDVAAPCPKAWDDMRGDEQKRFCGDCRQHVYDLTAMTRAEAESLIHNATGPTCVRMLRREDGTLVTSDCGPLRRAVQRRVRRLRMVASTLLGFVASIAGGCGDKSPRETDATTPDSSLEQGSPQTGAVPEEFQQKPPTVPTGPGSFRLGGPPIYVPSGPLGGNGRVGLFRSSEPQDPVEVRTVFDQRPPPKRK